MTTQYRIVVGSAILAVITGYVVFAGTSSNWQYYVTVDECLRDAPQFYGTRLRVHGTVVDGSLRVAENRAGGTFLLDGTTIDLPVTSECYLPDSLTDGIEAVAEGTLDAHNRFCATRVLTRCASKYSSDSPSESPPGNRGETKK